MFRLDVEDIKSVQIPKSSFLICEIPAVMY